MKDMKDFEVKVRTSSGKKAQSYFLGKKAQSYFLGRFDWLRTPKAQWAMWGTTLLLTYIGMQKIFQMDRIDVDSNIKPNHLVVLDNNSKKGQERFAFSRASPESAPLQPSTPSGTDD